MAIAQITHAQAMSLLAFCQTHKLDQFSFSNDNGAYFCAVTGSRKEGGFKNCVEYLEDMNPTTDDDAHGMSSAVFGGDDFGVDMPVSWLALFAKHKKESDNFRVQISATEVRLLLDI